MLKIFRIVLILTLQFMTMDSVYSLDNKPEKLEWLKDAGFGMFIHWSLDSQIGSVISHSMAGASDEYLVWYINELPKTFLPKKWDADKIARLAKLCGMQYVVFTAKHHNGFCWWDTETTDFKITNTPYGKDVLTGYVETLRRYGIKVGFYYSPEDFTWLFKHGYPVKRRNPEFMDPDEDDAYGEFVRRQVTELFTQFGTIDMLFIDGEGEEITKEVCWTLQPNCLITRGAIQTPEQFVPGRPPEGAWESNLTMGTQWQYKPTNDDYKSGTRIIELLTETRAKGGSLMLNIGPKPDGELPLEQEARLREVALWYAVNHEAIHDVRPWVVQNEENVWFARSADSEDLYVTLTRVPDWERGGRREFTLASVSATEHTRISVLGHGGEFSEYQPGIDVTPRFEQTDEGLVISVTRSQRLYNNHKWHNPVVVRLQNVEPSFQIPPYAETKKATRQENGDVILEGDLIEMAGAKSVEVGFEFQEYLGFAEVMYNTEWKATDFIKQEKTGSFYVTVGYLDPGKQYQFRAVVRHPKISIRGDHEIFH